MSSLLFLNSPMIVQPQRAITLVSSLQWQCTRYHSASTLAQFLTYQNSNRTKNDMTLAYISDKFYKCVHKRGACKCWFWSLNHKMIIRMLTIGCRGFQYFGIFESWGTEAVTTSGVDKPSMRRGFAPGRTMGRDSCSSSKLRSLDPWVNENCIDPLFWSVSSSASSST